MSKLRLVLRAIPLVAGVAALVLVVRFAGFGAVKDALHAARVALPALLLFEGLRIPLEGLVTRRLLGARASRVPLLALARAQLTFYAVSMVAPAGRVLGEASKAALLSEWVGAPAASALASTSQGASLLADALFALVGVVAVYALAGPGHLTTLTLLFAIGCLALASAVIAASRLAEPPRWVERFPRLVASWRRFREASREQPILAPDAVALLVLGRGLQVCLLAVALAAVGAEASPTHALALTALVMAGAVVGEAVPAQIGATDAVLVMAAPSLGFSVAQAASVGVLLHLVQLAWAGAGALLGSLARSRPVVTEP